jgi:membrane-bound lytic murein transglycosylase B
VVTRYNRSTFYASAVLELGGAIQKARGRVQLASAQAALRRD